MAIKRFKGKSILTTIMKIKSFLNENGINKEDCVIVQKDCPDGQNYTHIVEIEYHKNVT